MKYLIGDEVVDFNSGIRGTVIGYYFPEGREEELIIKSSNGRLYRGPIGLWFLKKKCTTGYSATIHVADESILN